MVGSSQTDLPSVTDPRTWESTHRILSPIRPHGLAAVHVNAREAKGLAGALRTLQQQPHGWVLLGITALGLLGFGVFQFVLARYRRISAPSLRDTAVEVREHARKARQALGE
jgi:hypothetical protein